MKPDFDFDSPTDHKPTGPHWSIIIVGGVLACAFLLWLLIAYVSG